MKALVARLQEFSIPLVLGVICAVAFANWNAHLHEYVIDSPFYEWFDSSHATHEWTQHSSHAAAEQAGHGWGHFFTLHFIINDVFMVLFFGIAAKEITESCLPGGSLNPPRRAVNPLFATLGGVLGPVFVFCCLNALCGQSTWTRGWGIPTATDIALAWLAARLLFGAGHPAINYLLLLAVADDAIGLGIIAIAYPDPAHPTNWANTWWILPAMGWAYTLRRLRVQNWVPYIAVGGALSWWGLYSAHLHPALALVFVVPFLPGPDVDLGLYVDPGKPRHNPLELFEHHLKLSVDFGLFFFAFVNAGVALSEVTPLTWIILAALIAGKTIGITLFAKLAMMIGFPLPQGIRLPHVMVVGMIAGIGLTVALFVAGQAYTEPALSAAAKMGAVLSVIAVAPAALTAYAMRLGRFQDVGTMSLPSWRRPAAQSGL